MRNISAKPYPKYNVLFRNIKKNKNKLYQKFIFFNKGREAMLFGLNNLKIDKEKLILLPAYICESLTKTVLENGYKVDYYDINTDLSIDFDYLKNIINKKNISVLVVVHYFGIHNDINDIFKFCRLNNIELIEDYCHSFLSRFLTKEKSILKTTKIYSIRKNIPVFDGGAIEISKLNDLKKSRQNFLKKNDLIYLFFRIVEFTINKFGLINIYGNLFQKIKIKINKVQSKNQINSRKDLDKHFHNPSFMLIKYLNDTKYLKESSRRRRENFNFLFKKIEELGFANNFEFISENSVPQFFPILLNARNKFLFNFLNKKGIETIKWPDYEIPDKVLKNKNKYPNSNFLNEHLILIPINQSLSISSCKKIINVINSFLKQYS